MRCSLLLSRSRHQLPAPQISWSAWRLQVHHAFFLWQLALTLAVDNVVRAGLTPKLRDVPTLTSMLTYTSALPSSQLLPPIAYKSTLHTKLYDPPIDEFSVLLTDLKQGEAEKFEPVEGPSILLFTKLEGKIVLRCEGREIEVRREGQVFFVGAGVEVELSARTRSMTAYRAFVEA